MRNLKWEIFKCILYVQFNVTWWIKSRNFDKFLKLSMRIWYIWMLLFSKKFLNLSLRPVSLTSSREIAFLNKLHLFTSNIRLADKLTFQSIWHLNVLNFETIGHLSTDLFAVSMESVIINTFYQFKTVIFFRILIPQKYISKKVTIWWATFKNCHHHPSQSSLWFYSRIL